MKEKDKDWRVYMDYAASTPVDPAVLEAMMPYWSEHFGNPSSAHEEGRKAKDALEEARGVVGNELGCESSEVVFTGSGTEANNLAIWGTYKKFRKSAPGNVHFLTTNIEHSSVEEVFKRLGEDSRVMTDMVPVYSDGVVNADNVLRKINDDTALVSVMYVNNEIGTVEPVAEIGEMIEELNKKRERKIIFHVDAAQAPLYFPVKVGALKVHMLTIDAQKIYGPKGAGALYVKKGFEPEPILYGGEQERSLRPGTQDVPAIVGLAKALELSGERRAEDKARMSGLQKYFFERTDAEIPEAHINGSREKRSPNNINISVGGMEGDYLALLLDKEGISVSAASACQSSKGLGSRVVRALVLATGGSASGNAVRFTMGRGTTKEEVGKVIEALKEIVKKY